MLNYKEDSVAGLLLKGEMGLERESLRITGSGDLARTPDPFYGVPHIVKDFSEGQVEINTDPWEKSSDAVAELERYSGQVRSRIIQADEPEYLWPFSNPPYLTSPDDIVIAQYKGEDRSKTEYRKYLAGKYGTYLMTFSGSHVNFSFSDELLREDFKKSGAAVFGTDHFREYKDELYLRLAEQMLRSGWILNILTSASPVLDGSFFDKNNRGKDVVTDYASVRCSEKGYWNTFKPVMNYDTSAGYVDSIAAYVDNGLLWAPSELYFPIRLKAGGKYTIEQLRTGWTHIEIRTFDLNPLVPEGIDVRDIEFAKFLMVWLSCTEPHRMSKKEKIYAVDQFRNAAHLHPEDEKVLNADGDEAPMLDEAKRIIDNMMKFYAELGLPVSDILEFEYDKLEHKEKRYAWQVLDKYSGSFVEKGLELAKSLSGRK